MAMDWADVRFLLDRGAGLVQRGLVSMRTRGLRATWERVRRQLRPVPASRRPTLYLPEPTPFAPFTLPCADVPRASIVIPVYNQFAHTLQCLRALAAHPPQTPAEIIVVDDGSGDETAACLAQVAGLRYHRRAQNGGFIAACNDGASLANGEYLVFLNNDTVPQPGWLDALLGTFGAHPGTGLVGAQLLYPDGRLQEAGGVIRRDGSADNLGRFVSSFAPAYSFVRRVDYCSGAAIAVPEVLFKQMGGFDNRYHPAYYEDTDLAMNLAHHGWHVLVQPAAQVIHFEGATSGTDTRRGVKAYQTGNEAKFRSRWQAALADCPDHSTPITHITDHKYQRKVLVIDALTPRPDQDSGSLRLLNLMRLLRAEQAHVVFLPADRQFEGRYTRDLQQLGVEVWYAPFAQRAPTWLREHGRRFDSVLVCRHYVLREFLPLLRRYAPQARVVFDTVDLHYLRERRGAELTGNQALIRAAKRTRRLELEMIARADATLVVSEVERALLANDAPTTPVHVLSNLHEVAGPGPGFADRADVVFAGGFRHPPNVDAALWFAREVFPLVRKQLPSVRFHCIGSDTPEQIVALASEPGIVVHGYVPDITPYMDGARIAVAPLRYGAGVKGKVNLSMAHGQPVVATSCAVEGMHLEDERDVLVADDAQAFAEAVIQLYGDEELWHRLAEHGLRNVERYFSLDAAREVVRRVLLGCD